MIKLTRINEDLEHLPKDVVDRVVVSTDITMAEDVLNHQKDMERIEKDLKPLKDNAKEIIKDTAPEEKLLESCKKDLKEGMIGQTLEDFIEDCNNLERVSIWCYDINEDGPIFEGDKDDIPYGILNAQFDDFDAAGEGYLSINVSDVDEDELDEALEKPKRYQFSLFDEEADGRSREEIKELAKENNLDVREYNDIMLFLIGSAEDLAKALGNFEYYNGITPEEIESAIKQRMSKVTLIEAEEIDDKVEVVNDEEEKGISIPVKHWTDPEDLRRINDELAEKAREGKVLLLRQDDKMLTLAEPEINGLYVISLDENGYITKIALV